MRLVSEERAPAWGLSSRCLCPDRDVVLTACRHTGSRWSGSGGHQPGSAAASGAARTPVISGCSAQVGGELFPFPGVHFRAVRPETDDCGVFLVRSEGTPGVLHVMVQKAIPLWQAGPGRQLWSETLGCDTLGFPISPVMACLNPVLFS